MPAKHTGESARVLPDAATQGMRCSTNVTCRTCGCAIAGSTGCGSAAGAASIGNGCGCIGCTCGWCAQIQPSNPSEASSRAQNKPWTQRTWHARQYSELLLGLELLVSLHLLRRERHCLRDWLLTNSGKRLS